MLLRLLVHIDDNIVKQLLEVSLSVVQVTLALDIVHAATSCASSTLCYEQYIIS